MLETVHQSCAVPVLLEPTARHAVGCCQHHSGGQLSVQHSCGTCGVHGFKTLLASTVLEEGQLHSATGIMVLNKATSVWMGVCFS